MSVGHGCGSKVIDVHICVWMYRTEWAVKSLDIFLWWLSAIFMWVRSDEDCLMIFVGIFRTFTQRLQIAFSLVDLVTCSQFSHICRSVILICGFWQRSRTHVKPAPTRFYVHATHASSTSSFQQNTSSTYYVLHPPMSRHKYTHWHVALQSGKNIFLQTRCAHK